jgi:hypothetical protein
MKNIVLATSLLLLAVQSASGQVFVQGTVQNTDSARLVGARIEIADTTGRLAYTAISDSLGEFIIRLAGPLTATRFTVRAEMLGYRGTRTPLSVQDQQVIDVTLTMAVDAIPLEPLRVTTRQRYTRGLRDEYFDRADHIRRLGGGIIIDYDQLQRRAGSTVNMIVAEQFPAMRNCPPAYFIDGMRATMDDLRMTSATMLEGIEIYRTAAQVPAQYQNRASCGAVLIWTQIGDRGEGKPLTWRRILITLGLIGAGLILVR